MEDWLAIREAYRLERLRLGKKIEKMQRLAKELEDWEKEIEVEIEKTRLLEQDDEWLGRGKRRKLIEEIEMIKKGSLEDR